MSLLIKKSKADSTKEGFEIYGIKTRFDNQGNVYVVLPITLQGPKEFKKLYSEISELGNKIEIKDLGSAGARIGITKGDTGLFSKNKKTAYFTYRGDGKSFIEFGTCPSQSETWLLDSEAIIDTIIRTASLGSALDDYQMRTFGVSKEEARRRRWEITPNAGFF